LPASIGRDAARRQSAWDEEGDVTTGVMMCGHGSRDPRATEEFELLALRLRDRRPLAAIETGCRR
jgi:hypothetical protein